MDFTQVPTVVAIIVITYLIGYASKQIPQVKDNIIPIIVGVAGGILGVVGMCRAWQVPVLIRFTSR